VVNTRGRIEAVSDSVPGSTHDLTLLAGSGVQGGLGEGDGVMLDNGHVGVGEYLRPAAEAVLPFKKPRGRQVSEEQRRHNGEVAQHRIVVEHTMAQLNRFAVRRQVFRAKKREWHGKVVAKVVNRRLAAHSPEVLGRPCPGHDAGARATL
jgi:hypothetical protein